MKSFLEKYVTPKYLIKIAILAIVYFVTARFGQALSYTTDNISLFWPAAGISLSALIIFGLDLWPGVTIGAFASTVTTQPFALIALGMSTGITLEALAAAYFLRISGFNRSFQRVRDVLLFIAVAAILSTLLSATFGTISLVLGGAGNWDSFLLTWRNWWIGDFFGDMIVAPAILVWLNVPKFKFKAFSFLEALLLTISVFLTSIALFTGTFHTFTFELQLQFKYLIFPFLIWASYRFRQKGSTFMVLLVTSVLVYGIMTGSGPFILSGEPESSFLSLAIFAAATSITFLFFSVIIEERDIAEKDILNNEKRFRSLIENSSDVIVLIDPKGDITYTSPSTYKVLQYQPEELLGTSSFKRVYDDDRNKIIKLFKQLMSKPEKAIGATFRLVRKDGRIIWVDGIGTNLLDDPGVSSIILNYRDVTERIKLEESKTEFVSLSAHQLRSPVATIRWYTESLMKEPSFPPGLKKYLDEIYTAVLSMNENVNVLLDVSRFEMGTIKVTSAKVDLHSLVKKAIYDRSRLIAEKKVKIVDSTKAEIPVVLGDEILINLIFDNLLSNAIKFSPPSGKIVLSLTTQKDNILFKIKDSGVGIPVKDQPKIFTKLYRGSNVNKIDPRGLGLGLYLVKQIINLKGGKIWFESEENKGTTFFVEFPKKIKVISK